MRERYPDEYEQVREQVERDLYPQLIEDWDARMAALATEHLVDA